MQNTISDHGALSIYLAIAMLAGCNSELQPAAAGSTGFNPAQTVPTGSAIERETGGGQLRYNSLRRPSVAEGLIHSFGAAGDGYAPQAPLLLSLIHI